MLIISVGEISSGDFTCIVGNMSSVITVCGKKVNYLYLAKFTY